MSKRKKRENKRKWLWEFSKKLLVICLLIYIIFFVFTCVIMWHLKNTDALSTFIEKTTDMLKFAVVGYLGKAGVENAFKIARSNSGNNENNEVSDASTDGEDVE